MMMIEQNHKGVMQSNHEAPLGCPHSRGHPNVQESGTTIGGYSKHRDGVGDSQGVVKPGDSFGIEGLTDPIEGHHRPIFQQNFCWWSDFHPDVKKVPQNHFNFIQKHFYPVVNQEYPILLDNGMKFMPSKMLSQSYRHEFQFQEFQYFVVIDFEATCDKEKNPHPQEIIEFPSVLVNSMTGQLEASFQTYVRPVYHQLLSDFCKDLTGIQQIQVDRGVPLSEALLMHDKWLEEKGIKHTKFAVVTWSNWDCRVMLESECRFKRIRKPPYFNRWINLKIPFQEVFGGARCNLKEAVQLAGLTWEGRAHCGLDDARNTARLLSHLMRVGFRFSITNSLMWQSGDPPSSWHQSHLPVASNDHLNEKIRQPLHMSEYPPLVDPAGKEQCMYCFCGAKSSKRMVQKPGPKYGSFFFGCGNWTTTRGALCSYFEWAST